jgi:hypothetical protein
MKKLLSFGVLLLLVTASILTASPLPFLLKAPQAYTLLKLSDVDVSTISAYAANNQTALISTMINGLDIASDVMVQPGVKNKIPMPKLAVGNGFRPYSGVESFKQKGLAYTSRDLEVKVGVRELMIDPEDYMGTYLAWVNSPGSAAAKKDIPFAQFLWDQVIKATQREINDETAYLGFDKTTAVAYDIADPYVVGDYVTFASATNNANSVLDYYKCISNAAAGDTPDTDTDKWLYVTARAVVPGIESHILTGITATTISPVTTGAITATSGVAIAAFKELFRSFSAAIKSNGVIISCSYTDFEFLLDDLSDKYKYVKDNVAANGFLILPDTNNKCMVKPASWLGTSRRLIAGPVMPGDARHMNLYMGTDLLSDANSISVKDSELWTLKAGIKCRIGFQIQDLAALKVGDQS